MGRVILHMDANSFYASVECLYRPALRDKPVSVCGDPEARHGIVLTSNQHAKRRGIKTGMAIWQARQLCPDLVAVPPDYALYLHFSRMIRDICCGYSDRVESFGLDECWVDVSSPEADMTSGEALAHTLRTRVKQELGITVSVGVSDNKIFAKLGSDMKKPDAVTVIPPDGFREKIWHLPAGALLYVGPRTGRKLHDLGICTIGDLARAPTEVLQARLGKNGLLLQLFANGLDAAPVMPTTAESAIKSIGNSTTTPRDIATIEDARCVFYLLAESVGARLRENGFRSRCVSISVRTTELRSYSCQTTLSVPTCITSEIAALACSLFEGRYANLLPLRSVGISCGMLSPDSSPIQLDMLGDQAKRERLERMDSALDGIRSRFGHQVIQRGVVLADSAFAQISPKDDHTIHPVPFFAG